MPATPTSVGSLPGLPAMDRRERIARLRATLDTAALLLTDPASLRYLTSFTGTAGQLAIDNERALFLTDGRYRAQLESQLAQAEVADLFTTYIGGPAEQQQALLSWLKEANHDPAKAEFTVGLEADTLAWADAIALQKTLQKAPQNGAKSPAPTIKTVPTNDVVAKLRTRKDPGEIARITKAAAIADQALADVQDLLTRQPTELEFARTLDYQMLNSGAEALSFETICASGPNSALPHARPTERRITDGDLVVLDFGAQFDGYHSDMTRTFCIGKPNPAQAAMLSTVADAQQAGVDVVRAGVGCDQVDIACRDVIAAAEMGDEFVHGTGHGVGLQIHEAPWIGTHNKTKLEAGNVVTVEPGVYRIGVGGVRVEDTVLVTDGQAQRLTTAPKDPIL